MNISMTLENAGAGVLEAGVTTFGQVFSRGEMLPGSGLVARIGGIDVPVQVDIKTTYDDGSAKTAVLSLQRPELAAGQSLDLVLHAAAAPAAAPAIDLAHALDGHSFDVTLAGATGTVQVDVLDALRDALAHGTASTWQNGPLASQARVELPLEGSQRLVFDVTAFADGSLKVDAQFNNDRAMEAAGGRVSYDLAVSMDGQPLAQHSISQGQYQNWHESFSLDARNGGQGLGDAAHGWLNIRQDIAHLASTGAIAHYDLGIAVDEGLLGRMADATSAAGWGTPLATNGVTQYMPGVGGRADIGFTTEGNTAWLLSQDIRAASYAMGQAEAASGVPWNMWDSKSGAWLNTDTYPHLWTDIRGGEGIPGNAASGTLTQHADAASGWDLDAAHQPDLSYVPYLLTGERWMLDNLQAQASWNVVSQWPDMRGDGHDLVVQGNQVRGAAWALRQIDEAAWTAPDGSAAKAYFTQASAENWSWLVSQIPTWTEQQGEAHGWLPGVYGAAGALPPWQQDYFASTAIAAARQGNADALTFLEWQANFLVGRFTHADQGFAQHDGAAYLIAIADPTTGTPFTTWAEIGSHTQDWGWSNGSGWDHSQGDYAQLALATLAGIAELTGSPEALAAYNALIADHPPFTNAGDYSLNPTYAIAAPDAAPTIPVPVDPAPVHTAPDQPAAPDPIPAEPIPAEPAPLPPAHSEVPLSILLSGDAWQGHAEALVLVNGTEVFRGAVTADHGHGSMAVALGTVPAGSTPDIAVHFLNDAWGGTPDTDRNLYVDNILLNGTPTNNTAAILDWQQGPALFKVTAPAAGADTQPANPAPVEPGETAPDVPAGEVSLSVRLSGDAFDGNPEAIVWVDGTAMFRGEIAAGHGDGHSAEVLLGHVTAGVAHDVVVQFTNDAWGGEASLDRNLYVDDILLNGVSTDSRAELVTSGEAQFTVFAEPPQPETASLSVKLSGDAFDGNPEAIVWVDGVAVYGGFIGASRAEGQDVVVSLGEVTVAEAHDVVVQFTNDAWGGQADLDRNLYVEDILLNGHSTGHDAALLESGYAHFTVSPGSADAVFLA